MHGQRLKALLLGGVILMMAAGLQVLAGDGGSAGGLGRAASGSGGKSFWEELFSDFFSKDVALSVPLVDVIILVVLVNVFALFKMARYILATSYLFCLKWVFFSNYTTIFQESATLSRTSMWIFLVCGILTAVLFLFDHFRRD